MQSLPKGVHLKGKHEGPLQEAFQYQVSSLTLKHFLRSIHCKDCGKFIKRENFRLHRLKCEPWKGVICQLPADLIRQIDQKGKTLEFNQIVHQVKSSGLALEPQTKENCIVEFMTAPTLLQ